MRSFRFAFAATAALFISTSIFAAKVEPTGRAVPGDILIKVRAHASTADVKNLEKTVDADESKRLTKVKDGTLYRMHSRSKSAEALEKALQNNPHVEYAEPNYILRLASTPNDTSYSQLWGLKNTGQTISGSTGSTGADIDAQPAWDVTTGSSSVVVGVIDTGIDYTHPDLAANMWSNPGGKGNAACAAGTFGYNAITGTCDPKDDHNHGTHVAGTIGAVGNNGTGVTGVNWTVSLMALKFLSSGGYGTTADAIEAIDFAVQAKIDGVNVRVLSNSWGGGGFSKALLDEINKASENEILFVAAAGNDYGNNNDIYPVYPATYGTSNMVSVAATDNRDALAYFSNYGPTTVHLGAPGVSVLSTIRNGEYAYYSGTSMATPHVSGVAALILAKTPALSTAALKTALLAAVDPIASLTSKTVTGGRLNAAKAVGATPSPDFYLGMTPTFRSITIGNSTTYAITVTPANGFSASVNLAVSGLPAGATASFSPATTTSTSTLTITTGSTTPSTYSTLTITATGGGISRSLTATLNTYALTTSALCPDLRMWAYFSGYGVNALAIADFNGDGKNDIAAAETESSRVRIGFGTGFGYRIVTVGSAPLSVATGDFDGDGDVDLATANAGSHNVSVVLGNGDSTFNTAVSYGAGSSPFSVVAGDFNGDGFIDLAAANNGSRDVSVLLGEGDGTFAAAVSYGAGSGPFWITVADLDRDGDSDLAVANFNDGTISILRGNGDGTFMTAINVAVGQKPSSIATGDFDRDGIPDLAVSDYGARKVFVLTGNGDGTFTAASNVTVGAGPYSVAVGDFNDDGRQDLVTADSESDRMTVLLATGDAQFEVDSYLAVQDPAVVVTGDLYGAGQDDIVVTFKDYWGYSYVAIYRNYGTCTSNCGTFVKDGDYAVTDAGPVATADFNRDGLVDVAAANPTANLVSIKLGDGAGSFAGGTTVAAGTTPHGTASADFNGDGKADLAVASSASDQVSILLGNGDGTFATATNYAAADMPRGLATGDFNRDGAIDLVVAARGADAVAILLGEGDGTFESPDTYDAGDQPEAVAVGDFDGDGRSDLAVANAAGGTISIFLGNGDGTFDEPSTLNAGTTPYAIIAADLNEDGSPDLAVANAGSNDVSIFTGNGDGTFDDAVDHAVGTSPYALAFGDWNGDGFPDLATANSGSHNVSILFGADGANYNAATSATAGTAPASLVSTDLDRDGNADLVVSNSGADTLSVLLNTCPQVDLKVTKTHSGNFTQGTTGTYTITVTNTGGIATSGVVMVKDTLPSALTATALSGTGWTCTVSSATCTRSDALAAGASHPPITVTVSVSASAPSTVNNQATVSGGGETGNTTSDNTATDATTINQAVDLRLTKSHSDAFTQGATGRIYKLVVRNAGGLATSGTVTVTDTLPSGLTATAMSGAGWSCNVATSSCTRSDVLAGGSSHPAIELTVSVAANAASSLVNVATVSGGGDANTSNNTASDPTIVWVANQSCGSFGQAAYYDIYDPGRSLIASDLNDDGKQDLALGAYGSLSIVLGNGDGTFAPRVNYAMESGQNPIAMGDLDGDGDDDIVMHGYNYLVVRLGNGDGTFAAATKFASGNAYMAGQIRLADVTGDGELDAVFAVSSSTSVKIMPGYGDGTFGTATSVVAASTTVTDIVILDADSNGTSDIAAGTWLGLAISLGNGDGSFGAATLYAANDSLTEVAVGDFNGDQKPDVVGSSYDDSGVYVFIGNGTGTFQTAAYYPAHWGAKAVVVADLNGDGKTDLLVGSDYNGFLSILFGNGNGTFQGPTSFYAGSRSIAVGDFNRDGKSDLASTDYWNLQVRLGGCPDLTITKTHSGNFRGGGSYAYSIKVSNTGAYSAGTITVQDVLPAGLTATSMFGDEWNCSLSTLTCTRTYALSPGTTSTITLWVNVSRTAPTSVTNTATVSGGGDKVLNNNTATDPTTIIHEPDLTIKVTHTGIFAAGSTGTYTITVGNIGSGPTTGNVVVYETLPGPLSIASMSGSGWNCPTGGWTCTRADALGATQSYPPITVIANVSTSPSWSSAVNTVMVSGGGDTYSSNNSSTDNTAILQVPVVAATAAGPTAVNVSWPVIAYATAYEVWRSSNNVSYALAGTTLTNTFQDGSRTANTTYFYKVRAIADSVVGAFSIYDSVVTTMFSDDPIIPGVTPVRPAHIEELRTAVNAYRAYAGLGGYVFTDPSLSTGGPIRALHVSELYQALNAARNARGMSSIGHDVAIDGVIRAAHINNLRAVLK